MKIQLIYKLNRKVRKIFTYIKRRSEEKKEAIKLIKKYQEYLLPGKYKSLNVDKLILFRVNNGSIKFIEKYNKKLSFNNKQKYLKNALKKFIDLFFRIKIEIKENQCNKFNGSLLLITYNNDCKVFNFEDNLVYNFYCKNKFDTIKNVYSYFNDYFNLPCYAFNEEKQVCIENYLNFKPYHIWSKNDKDLAIETVFSCYKNYFKSIDYYNIENVSIKKLIKDFEAKIDNQDLIDIIYYLVPTSYYHEEWAQVKNHGDLNLKNILLVDNNYYFIDWEYSKQHIFFHDLLNIFFVEAMKNDYNFLKNFLEGTYDKSFTDLFNIFNYSFSRNKKMYYLGIYLIERMLYFEILLGKNRFKNVSNKYLYVLNNLKIIN